MDNELVLENFETFTGEWSEQDINSMFNLLLTNNNNANEESKLAWLIIHIPVIMKN